MHPRLPVWWEAIATRDLCFGFIGIEISLTTTYSIVIPAYNEGARIRATLERVLAHMQRHGWEAEVLVVNDGSTDDTVQIVQSYAAQNPVLRLLENPGNRGKGYSVRNGVLHASGEVILFSDADLSSPIEEADKLFAALAAGADVAIGSRWLRAELQTQRQPLHRQLFGRIFNLALRVILGLRYRDTQCGFKAFTQRAAQSIFPLQHIERWGFDPEILYLARRFGYRVEEVPVQWAHREGTRINPLRDGIRMFFEMLKIRWYSITGRYEPGSPSTVVSL
jgi:dolichyl-phosphate beta-glucosyltransferase